MGSPFLLFPGDRLSEAELTAARLDGDLVEIGEGFMPADAVETAWLRAASLRPLVGPTLAATHLSAAWVHGWVPDPPPRHAVQRAVARRVHVVIGRRCVYRDPAVPPADLHPIAGLAVTTPVRTLVDLARTPTAACATVAARVAIDDRMLAAGALAWFDDRGRVPNKRRAIGLLRGGVRTT